MKEHYVGYTYSVKYRAYFFGNMYLSKIQQGIQDAHVVSDLFIKYNNKTIEQDILYEWAKNHKTMVLLNGGYQSNILNIYETISSNNKNLHLPIQYFKEEEISLNSAVTSLGVIVPNFIYEINQKDESSGKVINDDGTMGDGFILQLPTFLNENEKNDAFEIFKIIKSCRLA
jgi:hypothetical protein